MAKKSIDSFEKIIDRIRDYKYVSFDLFDTLIKRDVPKPSDVFRIIEAHGYSGFCEQRIAAERAARQRKLHDEVTLDEIYETLTFDTLQEEIDTEKRLCIPNLSIKPVYDFCLQSNKTILITTDIYLTKPIIIDILANCGYSGYSNLFVSSEERCMKASGRLYDVILRQLGIKPDELVHIGDNYNSDYIVPKQKAIEAIWINGDINHLKYSKLNGKLKHDYWRSFTNNHLRMKNNFHDAGYECFGPLLYGFTKWLIGKLNTDGIEKVYFLSRDGEIVKKVFDAIYTGSVESHYLYVSRRALLMPSLALYANIDDFLDAYHFPYRFTAQKFCRILGCEDSGIIDEILEETGMVESVFFRNDVRNNTRLERLYNETIRKNKGYIQEQYDLMKQYLVQERFSGKVAIVDIGWHGNMQKNLMKLVESYGIDTNVSGYYVAMTPSDDLRCRSDMQGYLFDAFHNQEYDELEQPFNAVFELLFTGTHGTILDYRKDGATIASNQGEFEIREKNSLDLIRDYQEGAIDFCVDAEKKAIWKTIDEEYIAQVLFSQFLKPNLIDAQGWGRVVHDDVGSKPVVTFIGRRYYLSHPKMIIRDYRSCLWKMGFMKQLFVVDLPYYKIIIRLNRLKKRLGK